MIIKNIENNNNVKIKNKLINEKKLLNNNFIFPYENINENIDFNLNNNFNSEKDFNLLNNTNIKTNIFNNNNQIIKKTNIKQLNNFF